MTVSMFREPMTGFYDYGSGPDAKRQNYTVLGILAYPSDDKTHPPTGWLLCLRDDGLLAWLGTGQLHLVAALSAETPTPKETKP